MWSYCKLLSNIGYSYLSIIRSPYSGQSIIKSLDPIYGTHDILVQKQSSWELMNTYEYTYYARSGTMLIRVHLQEY